MARKRKHEVKTSVKSSSKYTPIRKSSRQIAKKQLEERKINGKILKTSTSNAEEARSMEEIENQTDSRKNQNVHRKYNSHKNLSNSDDILTDSVCNLYKRDDEESDSEDVLDNMLDQSEKLSPEDVRQMVVGNTADNNEAILESTSNEVEVWPEEVIEEIICEEMEVEGDGTVTGYNALEQDSSMVVEQVLLMNKANLEGDNFVEYTVIKNEDGTQSMVVESKVEGTDGNEYQIIQNGMNNLRMNVDEKSVSSVVSYEISDSKHERKKVAYDIDNNSTKKKEISLDRANSTYKNDKTAEDIGTESFERRCVNKDRAHPGKEKSDFLSNDAKKGSNNYVSTLSKQGRKSQHLKEERREMVKEDNGFKSAKSNAVQRNQCSKEIEKLVNDLCSVENFNSPVETCINVQKISLVNDDDESSSSILDKMEQLHRSANCESNTDTVYVYQKSVECVMKSQQRSVLKSDNYTESVGCASEIPLNCRNLQKKKTHQKPPDNLQNIEDVCADSEADSKVDSEDMKLTSSGDSSNDTLLSVNNYKIPDVEAKGAQNSVNDVEKKVEFRSRSGSTDTTGSESGSNSSGVRRSNRIRTIGLMKQR